MEGPANHPVIVVEQLTARYGQHTVLQDVSFQVSRGEIFVIVGPSGCGKSTLLKYLIGLYPPEIGRVIVNGIDIGRADDETMQLFRMGIGVLFQSSALIGSMSLYENVALPLREHAALAPEVIDAIVRMKLAMVNLTGYEDYPPSQLSGGMRKRAGIARALALDPTILFFDELSAGLDPITSAGLDKLVKDLNETMKTTMVVVTHELESIFSIAHRVIVLDASQKGIIAEGEPAQLKEQVTDPRVHNFFNRTA